MNYSTFPGNHYPFSPSSLRVQPYCAPRKPDVYKPRQRGMAFEKRIPNYLHVCVTRRAHSLYTEILDLINPIFSKRRSTISDSPLRAPFPLDPANLN